MLSLHEACAESQYIHCLTFRMVKVVVHLQQDQKKISTSNRVGMHMPMTKNRECASVHIQVCAKLCIPPLLYTNSLWLVTLRKDTQQARTTVENTTHMHLCASAHTANFQQISHRCYRQAADYAHDECRSLLGCIRWALPHTPTAGPGGENRSKAMQRERSKKDEAMQQGSPRKTLLLTHTVSMGGKCNDVSLSAFSRGFPL